MKLFIPVNDRMQHTVTIGIAILAKFPRPGFAKTRLAADLGADAAAHLAEAMLLDSVEKALATGFDVVVFVTPATDIMAMGQRLPQGLTLLPQTEGDLGARMHAAFIAMEESGFSRVLLMGTDCPLMSQDMLKSAAHMLQDPRDFVLIPTDDGGYGLIGLCQSKAALFHNIRWSTAEVLETQISRAKDCGYHPHLLPKTYDIDDVADLHRLQQDLVADQQIVAPSLRAALSALRL